MDLLWKRTTNSEEVKENLAENGIKFNYITELAPRKGGIYEGMVKIVKTAFQQTVGRKILSLKNMLTLMAEIEGIVNTRPLTYISADSQEALRPIDFLLPQMQPKMQIDPGGSDQTESEFNESYLSNNADSREKLLKRWKGSMTHLERFWKFWKIAGFPLWQMYLFYQNS